MKNKIHYLFLCLCLACTAPFLTSCSDDDDSDKKGKIGDMVGQWVSTTLEEWEQKTGSNTRDEYYKEIYTTTLTLNADGTGALVEEDGDRRDFMWQYDNESGDLILDEDDYEGPIAVRITWQNGSKFTWLEPYYSGSSYCYYTQYIFTRK